MEPGPSACLFLGFLGVIRVRGDHSSLLGLDSWHTTCLPQ